MKSITLTFGDTIGRGCSYQREVALDATLGNTQPAPHVVQQSRQVHTITDRFSLANTYLINDRRIVIVDPASELNVRLLLEYMECFLHRNAAEIDLIVLTHLHADHTAGVEALRKRCNVPVAASAMARQLGQPGGQSNKSLPGITHLAEQVQNQSALPGVLHHLDLFPPNYANQVRMVDTWLDDVAGLPQHLDWRVIASPGHTPESLCLYNPFTYELLCGDTVITVEGGAPLVRGATDRRKLEDTLRVLRSLEVYYLYPGHGRPILARRPLSNASVEW